MKTKDKKRQQQDKTDKKNVTPLAALLHTYSNQQNNSVPWCKNEDHPSFA